MNIVVYGAQGIALGVYKSMKMFFPERNILCFLVTNKTQNRDFVDSVPVREVNELASELSQKEKDEIEVLISTPENVMDEIEYNLKQTGFYHYVRINSNRWAIMMRNFFLKEGKYLPLETYPVGYKKAELFIYKMIHQKDRQLRNITVDPEYVKKLQVGVHNTTRCKADFYDNEGNNISEKNGNYSELTGLFWMWKNQVQQNNHKHERYYGLAHYRRQLQLSDDDVLRLQDNGIDVILPYPMPYEPNIEEHHKRYLSDSEWRAVLEALKELQPEYAKAFPAILRQEFLYNYNVILAKGNVLDDYCEWLFPILFRIEELNDPNGENIPNRYIGYIGETLETLYFMYHKNDLRIAHTGCLFYT